MANIVVHSAEVIGAGVFKSDRIALGAVLGTTNAAGGGAGTAVQTTVTVAGLPADGIYAVFVDPHQDAVAFTDQHTASSFRVTLTPRLAANTLASGTFDCFIVRTK
jgi:hypothetical protein